MGPGWSNLDWQSSGSAKPWFGRAEVGPVVASSGYGGPVMGGYVPFGNGFTWSWFGLGGELVRSWR